MHKPQTVRMDEPSYTNLTDQIDDFYFSALLDESEFFPVSDDKFAWQLQLQEVLISSAIASHHHPPSSRRECTERTKNKDRDASSSSQTFCKICMEDVPPTDVFENSNCSHAFCRRCLSQYIGAKVLENMGTVKCPEVSCKGLLEPEWCRGVIPREVFERWSAALCEARVLGARRCYCPFSDCSALLVDDGGEMVAQSECPNCHRLFCARCRVAWHSGVGCEEFGRLGADEKGRDDLMLLEVALIKKWKRCPNCKFLVERSYGCLQITCRCNFQFCYGCGKQWSSFHGNCS